VTSARPVERDVGLQGTYAGFVTRFGSFVIDVVTVFAVYALAGQVVEWILSTLGGHRFSFADARPVSLIILVAWYFLYNAYPLAIAGRTFGMALVGVRATRKDGRDLDGRHAVLRVLAFPFSFLLLGFGFLLILLNRDRRALHDLIAGTTVIYSWNARAARLRFLAKRPQT
jgi:uncharacterized RDD family membrane protein YckC